MRFRDKIALSLTPLLLRVCLGGTLVWLGLGNIVAEDEVSAQRAADLANAGLISPPAASTPAPTPPTPDQGESDAGEPSSENEGAAAQPDSARRSVAVIPAVFSQDGQRYSASEFADPTGVKRVTLLADRIRAAGDPPGFNPDGSKRKNLLPRALTSGMLPRLWAWGAAVGEVLFGLLIVVGMLTRLSGVFALLISGLGLWLWHIGPALQAGAVQLGFLPMHEAFDVAAWTGFGWECSLAVVSLALVLSGAGGASIDALIFAPGSGGKGGSAHDEDDEDDDEV